MTQIHFLTKNPRGRHALRHLLSPPASGSVDDPDLEIDASVTSVVDAFTGAVTMANVEHHLARPGKKRRATITPPRSGDVLGRFCTMLWEPPAGSELELPDGRTAPVRDPRVLIPAMRVASMEEADALALFLKATSQRSDLGTARLAPSQAGLLATALPDLVHNGLKHGSASSCGVIVCAALEADNLETQLVVSDLGTQVVRGGDAIGILREAWARSREDLGALFYLTERAKRSDLDISVQIRTGNAAGRWRNRWNAEQAEFTPGWTASVTLHR